MSGKEMYTEWAVCGQIIALHSEFEQWVVISLDKLYISVAHMRWVVDYCGFNILIFIAGMVVVLNMGPCLCNENNLSHAL